MFAPVLIVASVAMVTFQSGTPVVLPREDDIVFDINETTGVIEKGSADAFDGFGYLSVNGAPYEAQEPFTFMDWDDESNGLRTIVAPPILMEFGGGADPVYHLEVSRKIYVPWAAQKNYIRYYDLIHNPTEEPHVVNLQFWGNVGRTGAAIITTDDGFAVIGDPADMQVPRIGLLFKRGPIENFSFTYTAGTASTEYVFVIEPNSSIAIVNFVAQVPDPSAAAGSAGVRNLIRPLLSSDDLGEDMEDLGEKPDFEYLTEEEILLIMNMFIDTDVNMDGRVNILDMICVRNNLYVDPESASTPRADVNHDDQINILDMLCVRNDLGWPF